MVQVVLPNDTNPLGFILGGTVMHISTLPAPSPDIGTRAAAGHGRRPTTCSFCSDQGRRSHHPEVARDVHLHDVARIQVDVYSEETLTGRRLLTSRAFLTFVAIARDGSRIPVTPLVVETEEEQRVCAQAHARRAERLRKKHAPES